MKNLNLVFVLLLVVSLAACNKNREQTNKLEQSQIENQRDANGFHVFGQTYTRPDLDFPIDNTPSPSDAFYTQEGANPRKILLSTLRGFYMPVADEIVTSKSIDVAGVTYPIGMNIESILDSIGNITGGSNNVFANSDRVIFNTSNDTVRADIILNPLKSGLTLDKEGLGLDASAAGSYSNTQSQLTANNIQQAIDEVYEVARQPTESILASVNSEFLARITYRGAIPTFSSIGNGIYLITEVQGCTLVGFMAEWNQDGVNTGDNGIEIRVTSQNSRRLWFISQLYLQNGQKILGAAEASVTPQQLQFDATTISQTYSSVNDNFRMIAKIIY